MDSGNSGSLSLQSSSGGGDEFDSRCGDEDSSPLSALLRHPTSSSAQHLPGFAGTSPFYGVQDLAAPPQAMMSHWSSPTITTALRAGSAGVSSTAPQESSHGDQAAALAQQAQPARASRKRTRASRRAPTTVLTTDTSNFRAMVQEFTGVPAPPFAPAARSSRFDHLFPSRALSSSPYLLRPFAHKQLQQQQPPPFVATPSPANKAIAPTTAPRTATSSCASYQQLAPAPSNVLGRMQGHGSSGNYLSFQSPGLLDGNASGRYLPAAQLMFNAAAAPDQAAFSDHGGDELSGLVGSATVSTTSCAAPPTRLDRNAQQSAATATATPAAAMRAPAGVESSWICTSDHQ